MTAACMFFLVHLVLILMVLVDPVVVGASQPILLVSCVLEGGGPCDGPSPLLLHSPTWMIV